MGSVVVEDNTSVVVPGIVVVSTIPVDVVNGTAVVVSVVTGPVVVAIQARDEEAMRVGSKMW